MDPRPTEGPIQSLLSVALGRAKPLRCARFFGCAHLPCEKLFSPIGKTMKKLVNSKYYHEHQSTYNVVIFVHLMTSKLLYLLHGLGNN